MDSAVRVPDIESVDWQAKVGAIGQIVEGLDDLDQCIITALFTRRGSVPLDPDFGSDLWLLIDAPVDQARASIVAEIIDTVARCEPRAELLAVTCGPSDSNVGGLVIEIVRRRKGAVDLGSTLALEVQP